MSKKTPAPEAPPQEPPPVMIEVMLSRAEVEAVAALSAQWNDLLASALAARGFPPPQQAVAISDAKGRVVGLRVVKKA